LLNFSSIVIINKN